MIDRAVWEPKEADAHDKRREPNRHRQVVDDEPKRDRQSDNGKRQRHRQPTDR